MAAAEDAETLKEQVKQLLQEKEQWLEEQSRLNEEVELLKSRVAKLARASGQSDAPRVDAETQTESEEAAASASSPEEVTGLQATVVEMRRNPEDAAIQLQGIEALFAQQTQAGSAQNDTVAPALHSTLEVAVAVFSNHPGNWALLLKASQFVSVLLAEPAAQQQLPVVVLQAAAQAVLAASMQLLDKTRGVSTTAPGVGYGQAAGPSPTKLLTWFLQLLGLLLPCLQTWLQVQENSKDFVQGLLGDLVSPLLTTAEAASEALVLKSIQLLPLLPKEDWIQKACLDSGAVHSLTLARARIAEKKGGDLQETPLGKAVQAAVRGVFANNLELCARALGDQFISDTFVCVEVLDELEALEKQRRGTFRSLDATHGIIGKAMALWTFHQRQALEDPEPEKCASRALLQKVATLLQGTFIKLPPPRLLERMEEFKTSDALIRIALAAIHENGQIRLQLAVNYHENTVVPVIVSCLQSLLRSYEKGEDGSFSTETEATFRLLANEKLPAEAWPYVGYCLEVCLHVLQHWSCTNLDVGDKEEDVDQDSAPFRLAQEGVVDSLAEILEGSACGSEWRQKPPDAVVHKAEETLRALFERNARLCLFCMKHYESVKQIIAAGSDSIAALQVIGNHETQQEAVDILSTAYEKFAVKDERLGRKCLKALTSLFESSYTLVVWYLELKPISALPELQSLDVHIEAVRAVSRTGYWSAEDAPLLPTCVAVLARMLLECVEGHLDASAPPSGTGRRVFDLTEAEEVAASSTASMLHLMLIDPSPPTVLHGLARSLSKKDSDLPASEEADGREEAVDAVMKIMQVFPSSDRVHMNCQHILTSMLGE
eukprot:TRINITY_DN4761_c0_g1_i1.p1 TRINITY_DN4761_c0_g1~~TRINITY_DN4761_c0_g1_i1.p1  ORF type:complete len:831 (+),score=212.00 TRINITY_DN4761_c0_g1_i1:86-2578(+)